MTRRQHFVTFYSPGTLFAEQTTKPIENWDAPLAVKMSEGVEERYGAIPYGFQFDTRIVSDPVSDGEGGTLDVEPKTIATSGMYFIDARLETLDQIEARHDPRENILRGNMRCNGYPIVAVSERRWRSTQPFRETDFVVDAKGNIVERGDDPRHVAYRTEVAARAR